MSDTKDPKEPSEENAEGFFYYTDYLFPDDPVIFLGIFATLVAAWGVLSQRAITRRQTTLNYFIQLEADHEVAEAHKRFVALADSSQIGLMSLVSDENHDEANREETEIEENRAAVRLVLNEMELTAIGVQKGIIDYKFVKLWSKSKIIIIWEKSEQFIIHLRKKSGNKLLYHEFEEMVKWLRDERPPKRRYWVGWFF